MHHSRTGSLPASAATALSALCAGLLLLAGCGTAQVSRPAAPQAQAVDPAFAQARALARESATLEGQARTDNVAAIERLLGGLDGTTLAREAAALPAGDPLYRYAGQALLRRGLPLPRPFDRGDWQFDAAQRPPAAADGYRPPVRLAVLLPLSGGLAQAAAPVRDGLLTAYYGEARRRPDIRFYDTAGTPAGAIAAYARAGAEGNDFVLGPLGRDEVSAVFRQSTLPVPLLALNRGNLAPPAGSASFSLSPEDEGVAAAEYLLDHSAPRVLVLVERDDGMRRAATAFRERLAERGGTVAESLDVTPDDTTLATRLQAALQRTGGVDAVFLALRGSLARELAPTLAASGLAGKPRVATSQLLLGTGKPAEDVLLDGIAYPTETWSVRGLSTLPSAASVAARLKTARGPAARLFAFGHDAWLVTAYLEKLALDPNSVVQGATGALRIDGIGNVLRTPTWSTFRAGNPVPLADGAR